MIEVSCKFKARQSFLSGMKSGVFSAIIQEDPESLKFPKARGKKLQIRGGTEFFTRYQFYETRQETIKIGSSPFERDG